MQLFPAESQLEGRNLAFAIALVAAGGSIGATARWAVGTQFEGAPASWPWATLIVNLVGCVLIGLAARRVERGSRRWDFGVTGLLGGFTTMSSFAVELNELVDADRAELAIAYGLTTVIAGVGILALIIGIGEREPAVTAS